MLVIFFVYYMVQSTSIDASPPPAIEYHSLAGNHCTDLTHCRTIWNIVWSCLVTIFSCTWVAVHPNVPCPKKRNSVISFAEHRLPLFICALLVPEYILAWSIRQFLKARRIAKTNENRHWSMAHGFFIIMGGFHLFEHSSEAASNDDRGISQEDDEPLHPLRASDFVQCDGYESFIMPTKVEIQEKGKSDWLAKSLVLLQTSWFVMQCIARGIEHLPVTHLEIVTLAYAAMNFVIYIFWWNKPLNVNRPTRVFRKSEPGATRHQVREPVSEAQKLTWKAIGKRSETIVKYIAGDQDEDFDLSHEDRVPRFWADTTNGEQGVADMIVLGVGVWFGAIHCIAWFFSFPTPAELLIWRISSVAITTVPIYIVLVHLLAAWLVGMDLNFAIYYFGPLSGGIMYILARAVTLALALTSLRDLPPGAYETVHWTTFIPHI